MFQAKSGMFLIQNEMFQTKNRMFLIQDEMFLIQNEMVLIKTQMFHKQNAFVDKHLLNRVFRNQKKGKVVEKEEEFFIWVNKSPKKCYGSAREVPNIFLFGGDV